MNPTIQLDPRPEAMADVPGVCELPLTRAVVQYRDLHEIDVAGGRVQDIGLALVLEGRYASSVEAVDMGSADLKLLDLSAELVLLDWAYEPTLEHAVSLVRDAAQSGDRRRLEQFCFSMALRILERLGYGPLTRPTFLRIGFRDICRDLDLHEGTSVRIVMSLGHIVRAHLDYDSNALVFRTATADRHLMLERALEESFPAADRRLLLPVSAGASGGYQVRFPLPLSMTEVKEEMEQIRDGLLGLIRRFEPERHQNLHGLAGTFGIRDTLGHMKIRLPIVRAVRVAEDLEVIRAEAPEPSAGEPGGELFGSVAIH